MNNITKELMDFADNTPGMIYNYRLYPDGHSCLPFVSDGIKSIFNLDPHDVLVDASIIMEKVHPEDVEALKESFNISAKNLSDWNYEYRIINPDLSERWLVGYSRICRLEDDSILWSGFVTDITSRKQLESELIKTSRLYSVTAQINQMVIHFQKRDETFNEACKIVIEYGNMCFAWIDSTDQVKVPPSRPSAWNSFYDSFNPKSCTKFQVENFCQLRGPHECVLEKKRTIVVNNIEENFEYKEWRNSALHKGFASSISLPIRYQGKVIGSFNLFSSIKNFFNQTEVELLEKVTNNISYGLEASYNEEKTTDRG